ncbi:hypothetical protein [Haloarcula sp. Atlit-7R]|uniref:hypothetical protein n=1 Tax=Haloarcula sp. Atlit-7R TaxID=2282125 RepID=UPI000EF16EA8|nr:hypothetical protein [Haloarcula sp. Atlit-7R]RLM94395.1 hypothetical protein D3D01_16155 [Haloarcula sp. Atlit-7R]
MPSETTRAALSSLDINDVIIHPDTGEEVLLIDYKQVEEYSNGVWAYGEPESGEYLGLIEDGGLPFGAEVEVEFVRHARPNPLHSGADA